MEQAREISRAQRGAIFALAKVGGLESDALHDVVRSVAGVESIAALTSWQAGRVIEALKRQTGQDAPWGQMTDGQRYKMYALCRELGWVTEADEIDLKRLEGFIRNKFHIDKLNWVNVTTASKIINGLQAMQKRAAKSADKGQQ